MNYFALFLDNSNYVEKSLTLIRFICNPESKTPPHITIRTYDAQNNKLEYTRDTEITHLEIIEAGNFNIEKNTPPYVVYIKCESDELEEVKYKPDYPFSRLHITLYEGDDLRFSKKLYQLLESFKWNFTLYFQNKRGLIENKIGAKKHNSDFVKKIELLFNEILDININEFYQSCEDVNYRLELISKVLTSLNDFLKSNPQIAKKSENLTDNSIIHSDHYIDASKKNITYNNNQLSFNTIYTQNIPYIEKPVQDAIYVTPPEYAREMAIRALDAFGEDVRPIEFGDSAVGTGALFLALKHLVDERNEKRNHKYIINSAIGVDIDEQMAKEAFIRCEKHGLTVIYGDAISPDINLGKPRNLMIVNPPYNRHENIPKDYRLQAAELVKDHLGITVKGDAGLFVYHLLIMDKWLSKDGIAVWLLPSIFLQSRYGKAIREYLVNNVQLLSLHVYDDERLQFDNTSVSTTIVTFKKKKREGSFEITLSHGDSAVSPSSIIKVKKEELLESLTNWRKVVFYNEMVSLYVSADSITFEDVFEIKRGLATGANNFFVMERREAIKKGIPDFALKPVLPKSRFLKSQIINSNKDGYPELEQQLVLIDCDLDEAVLEKEYPDFHKYLQSAKVKDENNKSIIERTLVKMRKPWYKQEKREAPPYLLTYMGRTKSNLPPLYFILNKSKAIALNTYLLLYPKHWLQELLNKNNQLYESVLVALNKSAENISQQTRVYSGGLQKLEPGELKKMIIIDLPHEIEAAFYQQYKK